VKEEKSGTFRYYDFLSSSRLSLLVEGCFVFGTTNRASSNERDITGVRTGSGRRPLDDVLMRICALLPLVAAISAS